MRNAIKRVIRAERVYHCGEPMTTAREEVDAMRWITIAMRRGPASMMIARRDAWDGTDRGNGRHAAWQTHDAMIRLGRAASRRSKAKRKAAAFLRLADEATWERAMREAGVL